MLAIRFTMLLLGLMVVAFVIGRNFNVHAHHELTTLLTKGEELPMMSNDHETSAKQGSQGDTPVKARTNYYLKKGRKLLDKEVTKWGEIKEVKKEIATRISGAKYFVGNSDHHKKEGGVNVECKLSARCNKSFLPMKANVGGLIPLSADYHVPRPHPPKNN